MKNKQNRIIFDIPPPYRILNRMQGNGVRAFSTGRCIPDGILLQKLKLIFVFYFPFLKKRNAAVDRVAALPP